MVCCSALQRVAVCCSVLQCVVVCCSVLQCLAVRCSAVQVLFAEQIPLQCVALFASVLNCAEPLSNRDTLGREGGTHTHTHTHTITHSMREGDYGVAMISRLLQNIGLFCRT